MLFTSLILAPEIYNKDRQDFGSGIWFYLCLQANKHVIGLSMHEHQCNLALVPLALILCEYTEG